MSILSNLAKSAIIFYPQVAAWAPDVFCDFYSVKNHKIDDNPATAEARSK